MPTGHNFHGAGQSATTLLPVLHRGAAAAADAVTAASRVTVRDAGGRGAPATSLCGRHELIPDQKLRADFAGRGYHVFERMRALEETADVLDDWR